MADIWSGVHGADQPPKFTLTATPRYEARCPILPSQPLGTLPGFQSLVSGLPLTAKTDPCPSRTPMAAVRIGQPHCGDLAFFALAIVSEEQHGGWTFTHSPHTRAPVQILATAMHVRLIRWLVVLVVQCLMMKLRSCKAVV